MARGYNPCIIEGCSGQGKGARGTVVCEDCRQKLRDYDKLRDRNLEGRVAIQLPHYAYVPGRGMGSEDSKHRTALDKLLGELRTALPRPARHSWYQAMKDEMAPQFEGKRRIPYLIDPRELTSFNVPAELAQFLLDLEPAIQQALSEAEASGKRQGSNLLAQLAAGELTSKDFEKKAGIIPG